MERDGAPPDPAGRLSLLQPRPGCARRHNEYVETPPLRPPRPKDAVAPPAVTAQPSGKPAAVAHEESIICRQCRRCRCGACRRPRPLPSRWVCGGKWLCSATSAVDFCSCVCCVRGIFYHWAKDSETDTDASCADQPCSCAPHRRWLRWGCLALLAAPLPCLCCYWPLRGCSAACQGCYGECASRGCRCPPPAPAAEKRLLDAAPADC